MPMLPTWQTTPNQRGRIISSMATKVTHNREFLIDAHLTRAGLGDSQAAKLLGKDRSTINRWRRGTRERIHPNDLERLAKICGLESIRDLLSPPGRISLDSLAKDFDDEAFSRAIKAVRRVGEK